LHVCYNAMNNIIDELINQYVEDKYTPSMTVFQFLYHGFSLLCCRCLRRVEPENFHVK